MSLLAPYILHGSGGGGGGGITPTFLDATPATDVTTLEGTKTFTVDTSGHTADTPVYLAVGGHMENSLAAPTVSPVPTINGNNMTAVSGAQQLSSSTFRPGITWYKYTPSGTLGASSTIVVTMTGNVVRAACAIWGVPSAASETGAADSTTGTGTIQADVSQTVSSGDGVLLFSLTRDCTVTLAGVTTDQASTDINVSGENFAAGSAAGVSAATPRTITADATGSGGSDTVAAVSLVIS